MALALLFFSVGLNAQKIKIGQEIPDMVLPDVINYSSTALKLSDFKGKSIIIDFWHHACVSCLKAFPKLDSLQRKFADKVQFILVNPESKDSTLRFFTKRNKIRLPAIPFVTNDRRLIEFFPVDGYPYYVWVDANRKVRYISASYNTTEAHLEQFIKGEKLKINSYTSDKRVPYTSVIANGADSLEERYEYYSYINHWMPQINVGSAEKLIINKGKAVRISSNGTSAIELFKKAFRQGSKYNFNLRGTVIAELSDSFRYFKPTDPNLFDEWRNKNAFNYDLVLPISKIEERYKFMQEDLIRFFDLDAKVERRSVKSWVLVRIGKTDKLHTNGGPPQDKLWIVTIDSTRYVRNKPFSFVLAYLKQVIENSSFSLPFYDETGYHDNVDFGIKNYSLVPFTIQSLKENLRNYGLDMIEEERETDVLVIRKRIRQ